MTYVGIGLRRSGKFCRLCFASANFRLWHMLGLAFVAVGSFADDVLLVQIFVFALQALSSPAPMSFLHAGTSSEVTHPGASPSSLSLPSEGRDEGGVVSGCPWFPSRGLSSPPARLWSSERGGGASGRSFGARELASVSSVHSWTGDPRVALLRRAPATQSVLVGSSSSSLHAVWGDGAGESSGAFSVLGCLSHLISARSVRWWGGRVFRVPLQLGFLPGFPIFSLGSRVGALSPLLVGWLSWSVLLLTLSLRFPCSVKRSWRCGRGLSHLLFSLSRSLAVFGPLAISLRSL